MARRQVDLQAIASCRDGVSAPWVRRVVREALKVAFPKGDCQVGVVIADDATVRRLNREYRGLDEPTDVLAFAFNYPGHYLGEGKAPVTQENAGSWVSQPDSPESLGEVVLSLPQAERQAQEHGHSLKQEVALLLVHGVLHLLGYDHLQPSEERIMKARETELLSRVSALD